MATILVVDASSSVRETIRIVLGAEHEVVALPTLAGVPDDVTPALVVLGPDPGPRDDRALGATLARIAPGVPLLLVPAAGDVDLPALVPPHVPVEIVAKPFDAFTLRARVRSLLRARRPVGRGGARVAARRDLEFPILPRSVAALVRRVLAADAPVVWLRGEPGTGAGRVARALHAAAGRPGAFVAVDAPSLRTDDLERRVIAAAGGTVYVARVDAAEGGVLADLGSCVEHAAAGGLHLIVGSAGDLGARVATGAFPAELAYSVTAVPIVLTPLRERAADLPALVDLVTDELAVRFGLEPVRYEPDALARLQQYLWFGNLAELEAVLARTLLVHRPAVVAADQILFVPDDLLPHLDGATTSRAVHAETRASAVSDATVAAAPLSYVSVPVPTGHDAGLARLDLEVVLGELAHELRNPMVTIKTFAQHLDSVLADPETRARFATLTAEAIGRMDGLLETLLDFARFRAPARRAVDVQELFERALAEQADELGRRHVAIERNGLVSGPVDADESQVLFAFRSLCRGLVPDLSPHSQLKVSGVERGVAMQVRTEASTAARLAAWVEPAQADGETPPLLWALAGTLFARNGGTLSVERGQSDATVIRVEWPSHGA